MKTPGSVPAVIADVVTLKPEKGREKVLWGSSLTQKEYDEKKTEHAVNWHSLCLRDKVLQ
jgi:hypothetical protein